MNRLLKGVDPVVLWGSLGIIFAFVLWGVIAPESLNDVMGEVLGWIIANFGWGFILIAAGALAFCVFLVIHPWGRIRLGPDDSKPDFSTVSWIAMMFAAGLGAGLLFYGIAEPISHLAAPPHGLAEPRSEEAGQVALRFTYFHWGFNGWALYAILGGALAYFSFRKGAPTLVSSLFRPILGDDVSERPLGRAIDMFAIVATLFGTATSLGLSGLILNSGLNYLTDDVSKSNTVAVILIAIVTALFVLSATSGVERGVQFLANLGGVATVLLMLFFLFLGGATIFVITTGIETIATYVIQVFPMSFLTGAGGEEQWMAGWTIFYWAWWISWAPFVGTFVARISRGRTIREFVLGVVAAPTGMGFLWFAIVGGTGIDLQMSGAADLVGVVATPELSLFTALDALPLSTITSVISLLLIALFFVSGADAAAVVMGMMASRGSLHPTKFVVVAFGVMMGAIASALLLAGGLVALQQAAILGSVPFTFILVALLWAWIKALRSEPLPGRGLAVPTVLPVAPGAPQPVTGALDAPEGQATR
jgi:glycine betaine transporter